jgi:hypothetical protein
MRFDHISNRPPANDALVASPSEIFTVRDFCCPTFLPSEIFAARKPTVRPFVPLPHAPADSVRSPLRSSPARQANEAAATAIQWGPNIDVEKPWQNLRAAPANLDKKLVSTGIGRVRDFFHELFLTVSAPAVLSTSEPVRSGKLAGCGATGRPESFAAPCYLCAGFAFWSPPPDPLGCDPRGRQRTTACPTHPPIRVAREIRRGCGGCRLKRGVPCRHNPTPLPPCGGGRSTSFAGAVEPCPPWAGGSLPYRFRSEEPARAATRPSERSGAGSSGARGGGRWS